MNAKHGPLVYFAELVLRFERITSSLVSPAVADIAGMTWNPLQMHSDTQSHQRLDHRINTPQW